MKLIDKDALVAEIEKLQSEIAEEKKMHEDNSMWYNGINHGFNLTKDILDTLEVKEIGVDIGSPEGDIGVKTIWDGDKIVSNKTQKGEEV